MRRAAFMVFCGLVAAGVGARAHAQGGRANQSPGPTVTVQGHTFTQQSLFQRNIGGRDDQTTAFPPHKIIGNIYYVGTEDLASYLVITPAGSILIETGVEPNVDTVAHNVAALGFSPTVSHRDIDK